mmetsp:Transcript_4845/g.8413  ORF Transcript_4845/g.8413 Transcript_4845/m.8413 type:complete len:118 (-) Transcript_4845:329-682(-)
MGPASQLPASHFSISRSLQSMPRWTLMIVTSVHPQPSRQLPPCCLHAKLNKLSNLAVAMTCWAFRAVKCELRAIKNWELNGLLFDDAVFNSCLINCYGVPDQARNMGQAGGVCPLSP